MKKFIVISIVLLMLAGFAITSSAMEVTLWAGQNIKIGYLSVAVIGDNLEVTYTMDPIEGWELGDTHLYVGTLPPEKSAPGQFPYGPGGAVYTIVLADFGEVFPLYIAAQAEVQKPIVDEDGNPILDEDGNPTYQEETAWADGTPIRSSKNWAMYFEFVVE